MKTAPHRLQDPDLLDRATFLDRVLFSQDDDLLVEATQRQRLGKDFAGVIYVHQTRLSVGECIAELELVAKASDPEDLRDIVLFLPLQ